MRAAREGSRPGPSRARRRRVPPWVLPTALLSLVLAGMALVLVAGGFLSPPAPQPAPVVLPVPTPTVAPHARERVTPFQRALPDAVLAFAVAGQEEDLPLRDAGAVEAYRLRYTDGAREVTLRAAQWRGVDGAMEAMRELMPPVGAAAELLREEPVRVGGREAGRLLLWREDGTASALWTNGGTLFALTGSADVVPTLYDAFPM